MSVPALTVGLTVYDDYDGAFFTIQSLRMHHHAFDLRFVVVDQNPTSEYGKLLRTFVETAAGGVYIPYDGNPGPTHGRNRCVKHAETAWVLLLDSHVLLTPDALNHLRAAIETQEVLKTDLIQGPLIYDDLQNLSSHWNPGWRGDCFGTWALDPRAVHPFGRPFEIPMTGVGLMVVHKDHWPGYNEHFVGFGGEEWYIHRKYRKRGGRVMCVPGLRWMHRFGRMPHTKYPLTQINRIYNTLLGDLELRDDHQYEEDLAYWKKRDAASTATAVAMARKVSFATLIKD